MCLFLSIIVLGLELLVLFLIYFLLNNFNVNICLKFLHKYGNKLWETAKIVGAS